jgi:hypothetical protein
MMGKCDRSNPRLGKLLHWMMERTSAPGMACTESPGTIKIIQHAWHVEGALYPTTKDR